MELAVFVYNVCLGIVAWCLIFFKIPPSWNCGSLSRKALHSHLCSCFSRSIPDAASPANYIYYTLTGTPCLRMLQGGCVTSPVPHGLCSPRLALRWRQGARQYCTAPPGDEGCVFSDPAQPGDVRHCPRGEASVSLFSAGLELRICT